MNVSKILTKTTLVRLAEAVVLPDDIHPEELHAPASAERRKERHSGEGGGGCGSCAEADAEALREVQAAVRNVVARIRSGGSVRRIAGDVPATTRDLDDRSKQILRSITVKMNSGGMAVIEDGPNHDFTLMLACGRMVKCEYKVVPGSTPGVSFAYHIVDPLMDAHWLNAQLPNARVIRCGPPKHPRFLQPEPVTPDNAPKRVGEADEKPEPTLFDSEFLAESATSKQ